VQDLNKLILALDGSRRPSLKQNDRRAKMLWSTAKNDVQMKMYLNLQLTALIIKR